MGVMMGNYNVTTKDGYFDGDIEKGVVNVKLDGDGKNSSMRELLGEITNNVGLGGNTMSKIQENSVNLDVGSSVDDDLTNLKVVVIENKVLEEKKSNVDVEKKVVKEKVKAMSAKKPPKPPRPPRGLSLDSADQKLIRELHELARFKRARVERMKALKKAKEANKAGSLKNQLFATLLTILFCLVLLLQGISSRTTTSMQGAPFSSEVAEQHNIISAQHYSLSSTTNLSGPAFKSPRRIGRDSSVQATEQASRAIS